MEKLDIQKKPKRTLVTRAIQDDVSLIIVTFNCGNDFEFHQQKYEECFKKYQNVLVLSKGIYQYHGHSFLIDQDLYYCGQESQNVSLQSTGDVLQVYIDQKPIYQVTHQNFLTTIFKYTRILLGECFNG